MQIKLKVVYEYIRISMSIGGCLFSLSLEVKVCIAHLNSNCINEQLTKIHSLYWDKICSLNVNFTLYYDTKQTFAAYRIINRGVPNTISAISYGKWSCLIFE